MSGFWFAALWVAFLILLRMAAAPLDRDRIRSYLEKRGNRVLRIDWDPGGPGWMERGGRIYRVRFLDPEGRTHGCFCRTSLYEGVYSTEDRVEGGSTAPQAEQETLEVENRRLREELARLRASARDER